MPDYGRQPKVLRFFTSCSRSCGWMQTVIEVKIRRSIFLPNSVEIQPFLRLQSCSQTYAHTHNSNFGQPRNRPRFAREKAVHIYILLGVTEKNRHRYDFGIVIPERRYKKSVPLPFPYLSIQMENMDFLRSLESMALVNVVLTISNCDPLNQAKREWF